MNQKNRKRLFISLGLLCFAAIIIWYFTPILMNEWFMYKVADLKKYLQVTPTYIERLPTPPNDWVLIKIGELSFKLPKSKYKKIGGDENQIYFIGETGTILISDLTPSKELTKIVEDNNLEYPAVAYQEQIAILKSSQADISFFKSRSSNMQNAINQLLKAISVPAGGFREINIVNPKILKAIIIKSEYRDKYGYSGNVSIYTQNEKSSFSLMLKDYKNKDSFDADLLRILGSIEMPNHQLDPVTVKNDIAEIVTKYKKTEQIAQPGRE